MFETILVPLDGSRRSQAVLRSVTFLAKGLGSRVTLLHVLESVVEGADAEIEAEAVKQMENARPAALSYLQEMAANLRQEGVTVHTLVMAGKAHETIVNYAAEGGFGLVAMATHGRGGIARAVLGSVATRVLQACPCPLLLVRPRPQHGFWLAPRRISQLLLPLDGSDQAEVVLPYAEELVRRLALPVMLIQVISVSVPVTLGAETAYIWTAGVEFEKRLDVLTTGYLAGVGHKMAGKGITVNWDVLRGRAAEAIVQWARQDPNTLIVMATRGRSGLDRWALGSVTDAVVREARVPVLVIPPRASGSRGGER